MLYRARIVLESYSNRARIAIVIGSLLSNGEEYIRNACRGDFAATKFVY